VVVPDVTGRRSDDASSALAAAGFAVQRRSVPASGVESGTVVRQSPPGGSLASRGSTVVIDVASPS
jgi:beta-lactam-binding protein with PASTA domain